MSEIHDIVKSLVHIPSIDILLIVGVEVPKNNLTIYGMDYKKLLTFTICVIFTKYADG